jgi:SAM-dependent methyltransferase
VKPDAYEAWYASPRGRWIATTEFALLKSLLRPAPDSSVLDIGCGTGHFTRLFSGQTRGEVVGLDPNREWLAYAAAHREHRERYVVGRAEALPFPDRSFDCTVSVTALCFVGDQVRALREQVRVTRRRFALGLLNRHSLLYRQKGRSGGSGGYHGAHWHTATEIKALLVDVGVDNIELRTAIIVPSGGALARVVDRNWPPGNLLGGFLAVGGDVIGPRPGGAPNQP